MAFFWEIRMASCGCLPQRWRRDRSQAANLIWCHCQQLSTSRTSISSQSQLLKRIMHQLFASGENAKFINNILSGYSFHLLSVCVHKTIKTRLSTAHLRHELRALIGRWAEDDSPYSFRLPYFYTGWMLDLLLTLHLGGPQCNVLFAAFITNGTSSSRLFCVVTQVICYISAVNRGPGAEIRFGARIYVSVLQKYSMYPLVYTVFPFLAKWIRNDTRYLNRMSDS